MTNSAFEDLFLFPLKVTIYGVVWIPMASDYIPLDIISRT